MAEPHMMGGELVVRVPGDKSITHRALLLAALADGRSRIRQPLAGADTKATAGALRHLGRAIPELGGTDEIVIDGAGLRGLRAPVEQLDCGNSGTTARLLLGILAGQTFSAELTGDASLRRRPMRRVTEPLARMGAHFAELGERDRLPIRIRGGTLTGIEHASPHASAQVKSALLLAGLTGGVRVCVTEPLPSRDHMENMLRRCGVDVTSRVQPDGSAYSTLEPVDRIEPLDCIVPGDFSSAAFVLAFAALAAAEPVRLPDVGLNPTRTGLLAVLRRMGAGVTIERQRDSGGEQIGDIVAAAAPLRATTIRGDEVPALIDEIPVIAALAARAEGTTVIDGAGELRVKESDRISAIVENLHAVGVAADELPHGLVIHGTARPLAGRVRALHDHRIAMAFGVLAAAGNADIEIDDTAVVDVSFPGFWTVLARVTSGV
jgi:3-phosphoshikimate 1-carboxyvinyltransferase